MLEFADVAAWEEWLEAHHATATEAWLRIGKKNADVQLLSIGDAGEGGLCFGWIDGQRKGLDDVSFLQRYSPRTPHSTWSRVNVDRAEALIVAGRMRPAGFAEIDKAKADGRWDAAYAGQRDAVPPGDLLAALASDETARLAFESMGRSEQYLLYLPLLRATTKQARERALAKALKNLLS